LLREFFCQRLIAERNSSAKTIASYRDAFRLLLHYAAERIHKPPTSLALSDLDAPLILNFLDYLEQERGNSIRSRNARLASIRSFMHYASFRDPESLPTIQRVLAIPVKRFEQPLLGFLTREEMRAIISAPDSCTWSGRRDHVMLATLYNTGARVSEIIAVRVSDVSLDRDACLRLHGKGRKERAVPLWKSTAAALRQWLAQVSRGPDSPVFPNRAGAPLSRSGVEHRLQLAIQLAMSKCPTLKGRRISPHTIRHTTAMHLLQSGVDITVIALWLGHESPATTHLYVEADLSMKERALKKLQEPSTKEFHRYKPTDKLLEFLDAL
jgi:site-specific recombinase XerD